MRAPLVCGVAGGVGVTTIAAALQARDLGVYCGGPADIVVCRSTSTSVGAAHRVINAVPGTPVLVVVADGPLRIPAPVKARIRMVEPHLAALVSMPYVEQWRHLDDALAQAGAVSRYPDSVPKWLQPWAAALRQLGNAVLPLLEGPCSAPVAAGVITDQPAHNAPGTSRDPRAPGQQQRPGLVVMQGSRPIPPSAAANH
ncbi:MAG: hypothetical protein JO287_12310 [Pseudonocardiales bacterium]|nr:hypothetical protein [Pseudonocardiales bacterium]